MSVEKGRRKSIAPIVKFLYDSLKDDNFYIEWTDKDKGKFKITDTNAIAMAWFKYHQQNRMAGKKAKDNTTFSYESFSRGLRYMVVLLNLFSHTA